MKTIKDLTPEIQAKIPHYIAEGVQGVFDGGRYNNFSIEKAEKAVYWNYEKCGFKKPVVIVAENIFEQQIMFNYLKHTTYLYPLISILYNLKNNIKIESNNLKLEGQFHSQFHSQLDSQLDDQLDDQLNNQLNNKLDSQLYSQLRSQLHGLLHSQFRSQLHSLLYSQLRSQLHGQLDNHLYSLLYSQLRSQLHSQLYSQFNNLLYSQLHGQLHNQLNNQLNNQLYCQLDNQIYSQLDDQLHSQFNNPLYSQLRSRLDDQLPKQLNKYNSSYLFTLNVYADCYFQWYKFLLNEFNLKLTIESDFKEYLKLQKESCVYSAILSEVVCVVSKYPKKVYRDEKQRLHKVNGYAVEWGYVSDETKFECYYIHGRNIPKEKYEKAISGIFTKKDFINETNEEIRGAWYEILGDEKFLKMLGAKEIDKGVFNHSNGDIEIVKLIKTTEPVIANEHMAWVKFICPSTQAPFLIPCEPKHTSAIDAAISLSIFNKSEYSFQFRS